MFRLRRILDAFGPARWGALVFFLLLVTTAVLWPIVGTADPLVQDVSRAMLPLGSPGHPLGTDELGRDIFARLVYGARIELLIALSATALAAVLGTLLGMLGAFFGGFAEFLSMRVVSDVLLAFPPVILALLAVAIYGPGPLTLILVMGVVFSPTFARLAYGQTLSVMRAEYLDAARVFGARRHTQVFSVVLPNIAAPLIVQFSLIMAAAILLESGLSYLGLGVVPPEPSWGSTVASGQRYMSRNPALILIPSLTVVLTTLSFSFIGDALRDWLDPRGKGTKHA